MEHIRCKPGQSVFEAADNQWGKNNYIDIVGTVNNSWEQLGTVTVRAHESFKVYRIPEFIQLTS